MRGRFGRAGCGISRAAREGGCVRAGGVEECEQFDVWKGVYVTTAWVCEICARFVCP